ncbi:MAG TPA: PQQ-binding-like beta-propeller repeat protein, partial [Ktedonobacteraceae bacterium]|nr:PQQ-binding-like beta-propeller repeat protein [Ktedonobacteraceae bacterium]
MNPEPGTDGRPAPAPNGHYESMVASDGIVYVGSDNGSLYALNGSDGRVLWQYMANAPVSVVAVVDGAVYAYADNPNSAVAFALNAGSGNVVWRYQVSDFVSKAMVVDKMVYLGTAATANQPVLYALQTSRGALAWRYAAHAITPGLLAVSDGVVYYAEISGIGTAFTENITALGAGDGRALWRLRTQSADGYAYAVSAVVNGAVYISTNTGAVSAARASDGTLLWHSARASIFPGVPSAATPLVADGMVYVTGKQNFASRSQGLDALRASDGKQLWTQAIDGGPGPQVGQPQLVDGVLYYSGSSGVIALRASDGARLWVYSGDTPAGPFFVSDGRVYANSAGGLFVLNASTGALLWKQTIPNHGDLSSFSTPLLVDGGIVYESSDDGVVQAYNAGGGQLLWRYAI